MKAQLLLELEVSKQEVVVEMFRLLEDGGRQYGQSVYKGNQLAPVREVILQMVKELAAKQGLMVRPASSGGFGDVMKQTDGVGVALGCGHPNTNPGEVCHNCGQQAAGLGPH